MRFLRKHTYLDYAASTPVDPRVLRAMEPYFTELFGNPGSLHRFGQEAIAAVDKSRETVARAIGAKFEEVIFTGSATEANNLALRGLVREFRVQNLEFRKKREGGSPASSIPDSDFSILRPKVIVSAIEHESVLETAHDLEKEGVDVVVVPVSREGVVDVRKIETALDERTVLVSVMYANNEIGTVQPIHEIAHIVRDFRVSLSTYHLPLTTYPLFHTDAVQAFQSLDCNVECLGVDLMTLSGHKIYGPKGAGALYVRKACSAQRSRLLPTTYYLLPTTTGGGQEFSVRSGTENVPAIVGFAKAVELVTDRREEHAHRLAELRTMLWERIKKLVPDAEENGGEPRLTNILNVYFPRYAAQDALTFLDLNGVAASSGSACRSRSPQPSHVIGALGYGEERGKRSIRFSIGRPTTRRDIDRAVRVVKEFVRIQEARQA